MVEQKRHVVLWECEYHKDIFKFYVILCSACLSFGWNFRGIPNYYSKYIMHRALFHVASNWVV
jgi:hypothetical protein